MKGCDTLHLHDYSDMSWFIHGLIQSEVDSCQYLHYNGTMVVYAADCLIFARNDNIINDLIRSLSDTYLLEDQGKVNDYLGIWIAKDPTTNTVSMPQPEFGRILQDLNLPDGSEAKDTSAIGILYPDKDGHQHQEPWNCRSLIGKLI